MRKKKNPLNSELIKYLSLISQLGFTIIGSILLFLAGAIFLEKKFQTDGILILIGVLLGTAAGVIAAYKLLKKTLEKE